MKNKSLVNIKHKILGFGIEVLTICRGKDTMMLEISEHANK